MLGVEILMKKPVLFLCLIPFVFNLPADAAASKRRTSAPAATGGGVMLSTPNPRTPIEHNNRGVELGSKGLWADAVREHQAALNGDPENQTFRINLSSAELSYARSLNRAGKTYEAGIHYREALYADPNNGDAENELDDLIHKTSHKDPTDLKVRLNMGEEAEVSGNFPVAIVEYRKCIKINDNGPNHVRLGSVMEKQGKVVEGFVELTTALKKDWSGADKKELSDCHRLLGEILKNFAEVALNNNKMDTAAKRLNNAAIEYKRALTVLPDSTESQRGLIEVAREAVGLNPNSFENHLMLGGAYQLNGDFDRAKDEYEKCWRVNRNDPRLALARRSYHLAVVSHPSLASPLILASTMQKVENNLADNPNDPELLYIYGRGKEAQQDPTSALKAYQAAAAINPYIFPDLQDRIRSLGGGGAPGATASGKPSGKPGDTKGATASAGSLSTGSPATPPVPEGPQPDTAGYSEIETKMSANDLDGAEKKATSIVDKNPKDAHAWLLMGRVREMKKDLDSASVAYRMANSLKDPDAQNALTAVDNARVRPFLDQADKLISEGKDAEAASALQDAENLAPSMSSIRRKLAELYSKLGDKKKADAERAKADMLDNPGKAK
jgi:tetratricopeptide (TPR) repeat protein